MFKISCAAVGASMLVLAPAQAQEIAVFAAPTVDYQGERTLATPEVSITQDIYSASGKTRTETFMNGQETIQIWRQDLEQMIVLMPSERIAMEMDLKTASGESPFSNFDDETVIMERRSEGTERVNSLQAEKSYISARMSTGETASGWVWATPQNITVRMRLNVTETDGNTQAMNYDLRNLEIRPQHDSLFEVPAGYRIVSSNNPAMAAMGGYMGGLAEEAKDTALNEADRTIRGKVREETSRVLGKLFGN